jgi:hypothetical protein
MEKQFRLLRTFSVIFKVLAWACLVIGIVGAIGVLVSGGTPETPRVMGPVILLVFLGYFLLFYTGGEVIQLLLAIEENTRHIKGVTPPG